MKNLSYSTTRKRYTGVKKESVGVHLRDLSAEMKLTTRSGKRQEKINNTNESNILLTNDGGAWAKSN